MKPSRSAAVLAAILFAPGCGPSPDDPLPPETDLYAYSLAVAEKARLTVGGGGAKALFYVGRVHERFGLEDKALEIYAKVSELDPNFAQAYRRTGHILSLRKDKMPQSIAAYQQALRCDPTAAGVATAIGLVLTHMGTEHLNEAIDFFRQEEGNKTGDADTQYYLGKALGLLGKHREAVEAYRMAIQRGPETHNHYYNLAQSLRAAGDNAGADEAQRKFLELKGKQEAADAARPQEKDNRKEHVRFASETWADAADVYSDAASAAQGERRGVLERKFVHAIDEALRIDPLNLEARRVRVEYAMSRGDFASALASCAEGLKLPGGDALAGLAYQVAGRSLDPAPQGPAGAAAAETAYAFLGQILAVAPNNTDARRERAKIVLFRLRGKPELLPAALADMKAALASAPSAQHHDLLAFAYLANGRADLAEKTLRDGITLFPADEALRKRLEELQKRRPGQEGAQ